VIVVDNGSTDDSAAVARAGGARVVHEPRRGFGAACFAGLRAAGADVVAFMDCDGSLDAKTSSGSRDQSSTAPPIWSSAPASPSRERGRGNLRVANRHLARAWNVEPASA